MAPRPPPRRLLVQRGPLARADPARRGGRLLRADRATPRRRLGRRTRPARRLAPGDARPRRRSAARRLRRARRHDHVRDGGGPFQPTSTSPAPGASPGSSCRRPAGSTSRTGGARPRAPPLRHARARPPRRRRSIPATAPSAASRGASPAARTITSPASARSRWTSTTAASPSRPGWRSRASASRARTTSTPPTGSSSARATRARSPSRRSSSRRGYILTTETDLRAIFALCSEPRRAARRRARRARAARRRSTSSTAPRPRGRDRPRHRAFGRPRMPPRLAFAPWHDAIFGSANVRAVAQKLRAAGVPRASSGPRTGAAASGNGDNYTLNEEWDVDRTLYPDMKQLADDSPRRGLRVPRLLQLVRLQELARRGRRRRRTAGSSSTPTARPTRSPARSSR